MTDESDAELRELRTAGMDRALHATATARIFEDRSTRLNRGIRFVSFLGLVVPIIIGGLALSYGVGFKVLPLLIAVGSAVGLVQLVASLWSVVSTWVEKYDHAVRSTVHNRWLARAYEELVRSPNLQTATGQPELKILMTRDDAQREADYRAGVSEPEKRKGMRAALIKQNRPCVKCKITPPDMTPTECGVCGDFSRWT